MHPVIQLLSTEDGQRSTGVIDLRQVSSYLIKHIRNSLHISGVEGLRQRFSWLPPPKSEFYISKGLVVVFRQEDGDELRDLLNRWNVVAYVEEHDDLFWCDAAKVNRLLITTDMFQEDTPAILFKSSPILEIALRAVENSHFTDAGASPPDLTILDLGMGAGRDLAWTVRRNSQFVWLASGIDNLLPAVERVKLLRHDYQLGQREGSRIESLVWAQALEDGSLQALQLANISKSRKIHLKEQTSISPLDFAKNHLPHDTYDLILFVRFFPRELINRITELTHDKTVIAISHFTTIESEVNYASPEPSKRFEETHICHYLKLWGHCWKVISQSLDRSEDGRPLRSVIFQRNDAPVV